MMHNPDESTRAQGDPLPGARPVDQLLRRLQEEHEHIAGLAADVARLTRPGQLDGPGAQGLELALRSLRDLLPAHVMNELSIAFPEVEAAIPGTAHALAEARRLHGGIDAQFTNLQAKAIPLLLGVTDPRVQRAARRAALSLQRECAALQALGQTEPFVALMRQLPPEAASKVLAQFEAADARRKMKDAARP